MTLVKASTRVSIRWIPDPPSEPTDTLVLSVGEWYVDLRVGKEDASRLDWAMAGQRIVVSKKPEKVRFTHVIDSTGFTGSDDGDFVELPNGDSLETGTMPCPSRNNTPTAYEEIWRKLPLPDSTQLVAWVLQSEIGNTFLCRVNRWFLALQQDADRFDALREDLVDGNWEAKVAIGEVGTLPSFARDVGVFEGEREWRGGDVVCIKGQKYVVRAVVGPLGK
ncbi:hypothetical protein DFS34DRAFT_398548 [Phlyctochytrium arcticum]|nr:hypothetical protein DFS34DRAFT_398548 [Phlyctochytrium arcticum]